MDLDPGEAVAINRSHWDAITPGHLTAGWYDVDGFKAGRDTIDDIEQAGLGAVHGKTLLHLQCHFGMDTMSLARRGAIATGVDFSDEAIDAARKLAAELGIAARFVSCDLYSLHDALHERFDVVFTSYGVLGWLPDIARWGRVVAHFLKQGGRFFVVDSHPVLQVFDDWNDEGELRHDDGYFARAAIVDDQEGSYADPAAPRTKSVWYIHPLEDVVMALIDAGLTIEEYREYDRLAWQGLKAMVQGEDGFWRLPEEHFQIPLMFSIRATRK